MEKIGEAVNCANYLWLSKSYQLFQREHTHRLPSMDSGWVMSASPYCYCDGFRFKGQQSAFISQTYSLSLSHGVCLSALSHSCPYTTSVSFTHTQTKVGSWWGWCQTDNSLLCQTHTLCVVDWSPLRCLTKARVPLQPIELQIRSPGRVPISICLPTEQREADTYCTVRIKDRVWKWGTTVKGRLDNPCWSRTSIHVRHDHSILQWHNMWEQWLMNDKHSSTLSNHSTDVWHYTLRCFTSIMFPGSVWWTQLSFKWELNHRTQAQKQQTMCHFNDKSAKPLWKTRQKWATSLASSLKTNYRIRHIKCAPRAMTLRQEMFKG